MTPPFIESQYSAAYEGLSIERKELLVKQFGMLCHTSEYALAAMGSEYPKPQVEWMFNAQLRSWCSRFNKYLPTRELCSYRWPATWWDAVKARWFPAWALQRWPATYEGVDLEQIVNMEVPRSMGPSFYYLESKYDA